MSLAVVLNFIHITWVILEVEPLVLSFILQISCWKCWHLADERKIELIRRWNLWWRGSEKISHSLLASQCSTSMNLINIIKIHSAVTNFDPSDRLFWELLSSKDSRSTSRKATSAILWTINEETMHSEGNTKERETWKKSNDGYLVIYQFVLCPNSFLL